MWLNYSDSEVNKFHPVCEKALKLALKRLKKEKKYVVAHHDYVGSLEMDFVIRNKETNKILCVIEVKRTPTDVQSTRYQYQAMSYIQNGIHELEKPFYILTNLETALCFRYDKMYPQVFQQILEPGLCMIAKFKDTTEKEFTELLARFFENQIEKFIRNDFNYSFTLDELVNYIAPLKSDLKEWKTNLSVIFYEYIRGAFSGVNRTELKKPVLTYTDMEVMRDCAKMVNFKDIFDSPSDAYLPRHSVGSKLLQHMHQMGKKNISADAITNVLYDTVAEGNEHEGDVPTDLSLANFVVILGDYIRGGLPFKQNEYVFDPAGGSGNLISAAIPLLNLLPNHVKVNDVNPFLIDLLCLRLGLNFASTVSVSNSPIISNKNILDLNPSDFNNVTLITLNPPYIRGTDCSDLKQKFATRIAELTNSVPVTNIGQIGLESLFLELVTALVSDNTVISCIMPKQYLVAGGIEAQTFRKFLINNFGLELIFNYPRCNLFKAVVKDTCVLVGRKKSTKSDIKVFTSIQSIQDIDLVAFKQLLAEEIPSTEEFHYFESGIEAIRMPKQTLKNLINKGWMIMSSEKTKAIEFIEDKLLSNQYLSTMKELNLNIARGKVANSGASDLLYIDSNEPLFSLANSKGLIFSEGLRNADRDSFVLDKGDSKFLNISNITDLNSISEVVTQYISTQSSKGKQTKVIKTKDELMDRLRKEARFCTPINSILIPRNLRVKGRVHLTETDLYVSSNFFTLKGMSKKDSIILSSWMTTIFYQLVCEVYSKDQEGTRKMEKVEILNTIIPKASKLNDVQYNEILNEYKNIDFLHLQNPTIRKIDRIWAQILFGATSDNEILVACNLLKSLAKSRNSLKK